MPAYTTLAAALAATVLAASGSLAADAMTEHPAKTVKPSSGSSSQAAAQRKRQPSAQHAPVRWDALDPSTIERVQKRRSIEVPSFPPERQ